MAYEFLNLNPLGKRTDDCVIRALAKSLDVPWDIAYIKAAMHGILMGDMLHKNYVWGDLLMQGGFSRHGVPDTCPNCYTVAQFAEEHPYGLYVVGTGDHVLTVEDGTWFDTWDSGGEVPIIYYHKE